MKLNMKLNTIIIILAAVMLTVAGIAVAAVVLTSPEHAADTPKNTPTPTPTATASPSPTPTIQPTELHLSSNLTIGSFFKGDTLRIVASLNQPVAGINITLYNNGSPVLVSGNIVSALTNSTGKAVFDRQPLNTFDYIVKATLT